MEVMRESIDFFTLNNHCSDCTPQGPVLIIHCIMFWVNGISVVKEVLRSLTQHHLLQVFIKDRKILLLYLICSILLSTQMVCKHHFCCRSCLNPGEFYIQVGGLVGQLHHQSPWSWMIRGWCDEMINSRGKMMKQDFPSWMLLGCSFSHEILRSFTFSSFRQLSKKKKDLKV